MQAIPEALAILHEGKQALQEFKQLAPQFLQNPFQRKRRYENLEYLAPQKSFRQEQHHQAPVDPFVYRISQGCVVANFTSLEESVSAEKLLPEEAKLLQFLLSKTGFFI